MHSERPHSCPKSCGRLATAAVFVSIAVVQFIAGLILLKSDYVYLLSGPDFWTAAANLAVGVLLGLSASVWKDVQKKSFKHVIRRNILASLVASAMIMNTTTAIILILGEGNALLSIELDSSTSEILAYSYATSVCSPIVSVVVATVFLSDMWFRVSDKGMKTPEIKSILKKDSMNEYNWVFKGRQSPHKQDSKNVRKELSFKSLSSSSDEESFSLTDAKLWSNSVRSIEYFNTSRRKGSHRLGMHRHSKVQQESALECGEHVKNLHEINTHEANRVSFANNTKTRKFLKFSPYISQSLIESDRPFYTDHIKTVDKDVSSLSYEELKKMHRQFENAKQRNKKRRILLTEHPAFQQSKLHLNNMNEQSFHKLDSREVYIPRVHVRMVNKPKSPTTSEVKADVHVVQENQDWVADGNSSGSPTVQCEEDASTNDTLTETVHHKHIQFRRSSTLNHLNNVVVSQQNNNDLVDRKVYRTSTAAESCSPNVSHLDISDIQNDSVIDQNEFYESEEEKDTYAVASPNSSNEMDYSFIDVAESNELAGEVVKVQVNSLLCSSFHSKLIPVSIPIVSSVMKNPLKRKHKDPITKAPDKFSDRSEHPFSSFHGDIKAINQGSVKADGENRMNPKYEPVDEVTICEMSPDNNIPSSPAQTSGYASAIFENTHLSSSECFKPNLSIADTKSPYYTPKRKFENFPSPRNLDNVNGIGVENKQHSQ